MFFYLRLRANTSGGKRAYKLQGNKIYLPAVFQHWILIITREEESIMNNKKAHKAQAKHAPSVF